MVKVLVAAPIYAGKDYCVEKYIQHIRNIDYDDYDFILVDNTDDEGQYTERLKTLGVEAYHVERGDNSRDAIANAMNFIRHYAQVRHYDYILIVETDLFPDPQVINRLLSHCINNGLPVVGSYYLLGFEEDSKKLWSAIKEYQKGDISKEEYEYKVRGLQPQRACIFYLDKKNTGLMGSRCLTPKQSQEHFRTGLRRVHGVGMGCTMIRNDIFQRFPSWSDNRLGNKHPDVYFYLDLQNNNIPVYVDTNVNIPHQPRDWAKVRDM